MDDFEQTKSCWGITVRAVAVFAGLVAFAAALSDEGAVEVAAETGPTQIVAER